MERKRRSRAARRAALLASTAIIALLTGCQSPGHSPQPADYSGYSFGGAAW
jgi:hypothetical protein